MWLLLQNVFLPDTSPTLIYKFLYAVYYWWHFIVFGIWTTDGRFEKPALFLVYRCLHLWLNAFWPVNSLSISSYFLSRLPSGSTWGSLRCYVSLSLLLCRSVCLPLPISFSLTSVKCNWSSSLHMAHRHTGDTVCAVAANCSLCSSEPIPLFHFSPPSCHTLPILSQLYPSALSTTTALFLTTTCCFTGPFYHFVKSFNRITLCVL